MDILISSNLERLIYKIAGNDAAKNKELMTSLTTTGKYDITDDMRAELKDFYGNYATEKETAEEKAVEKAATKGNVKIREKERIKELFSFR